MGMAVRSGESGIIAPVLSRTISRLRYHPHATCKLLFNGLYCGSAKPAHVLKGLLP
jgi:hypothetical protein